MAETYEGACLRVSSKQAPIPSGAKMFETYPRLEPGNRLHLTPSDPPAEATHWTAGAMAKAVGISASSAQQIWRAHGLQPL